ncbi:PHD finger-like domain-containing protein 5A isoform X2 [Chroicocephalus ridibundus]|uniref:PHD finger-like domain-containing protein 5A isoform X2 n=1 Tax=Chroicocephalus ridibundus TaxID=1192867 RepID=UPI002FDD576B
MASHRPFHTSGARAGAARGRGLTGPGREVSALRRRPPGKARVFSGREKVNSRALRGRSFIVSPPRDRAAAFPLGAALFCRRCPHPSQDRRGTRVGGERAGRPRQAGVGVAMAKHHPDLIFCRKQAGVAIGRLCEKYEGLKGPHGYNLLPHLFEDSNSRLLLMWEKLTLLLLRR